MVDTLVGNLVTVGLGFSLNLTRSLVAPSGHRFGGSMLFPAPASRRAGRTFLLIGNAPTRQEMCARHIVTDLEESIRDAGNVVQGVPNRTASLPMVVRKLPKLISSGPDAAQKLRLVVQKLFHVILKPRAVVPRAPHVIKGVPDAVRGVKTCDFLPFPPETRVLGRETKTQHNKEK